MRLERLAGALDGGRAVGGAPRAVLDDVDGVAGVGLDGADERGDRAGGRLRLLGELAHLLGDDGEAAALLARARGLDGGVERQQVGLRGDGGDGLDDAADLVGLAPPSSPMAALRRARRPRGRPPSRRSPRARRRRRRRPGRGASAAAAAVPARRRRTGVVAAATSATVSRRRRHARAPGARRRRRPPRRRGRSRPRRGRCPRSRWPAGARRERHGRGGQRHLADHRGQRGAGGVVGLHRGRGVVADLAHGLGHVADLVARAPADRRGDGRQLEGQVARGEAAEAVAQAGDVVAAQGGQARDGSPPR